MGKKAIFFDIDGTIWDRDFMPESAVEGIRRARRNGHLVFINSGRSRGMIFEPRLLDIGFDGIVSGCSTMVEYHDQVLYKRSIEPERAIWTVETMRRYGFKPILEGATYIYFDEEEFEGIEYGRLLKEVLGDHLKSVAGEWGSWDVSKFSCDTQGADLEGGYRALSPYYEEMIHNPAVAEFTPKGFDKGLGIRFLCEKLGIDIADTICFGDSVNDLGMLRTAGTAVVMGNGCQQAKDIAALVTAPLEEDGLYLGLERLGLL